MTANNRVNLTKIPTPKMPMDYLEAQKEFFQRYKKEGFEELFDEINPIADYTGLNWEIAFEGFEWGEPKISFRDAQLLGQTYDAPVHANVRLLNKKTGEIKKQKIYLCDMPLMSDRASFMINGNERVVVFQILRSEGLLFSESKASSSKKKLYSVKLMPHRGNWYEFEVNKYGVMSIKLLQKRPRILLTTLLRALGYSSDADIKRVLGAVDTVAEGETSFIDATLRKDPTKNTEEALVDIYRKLRPEDTVTLENAKALIDNIFFNKRRFYLGKIGRYKLNKKLNVTEEITNADYILKKRDIVEVIKRLIQLNHKAIQPDDIDSLSNRRIRGVDELVAEKIRVGVLIMEKNIKDKMATFSTDEKVTPAMVVNTRPIVSAINQFFGSSALMRFMDQSNIFSELEAKRKITAGGPRGLTKERATFSVRDVHNSHYARLCPVTTPEGPSIGMVNQLAIYTKINEYGFLEAPYFNIINKFKVETDKVSDFKNRTLLENLVVNGKTIGKAGEVVSTELIEKAKKAGLTEFHVRPFITNEIVYIDADTELEHKIASASVHRDEQGNLVEDQTYVRDGQNYAKVKITEVDYLDVSPAQIASMGLALIPFAGNDDPNRTLIGAKTQGQAIPLIRNESPIVGTGFETEAARASGRTIYARAEGTVIYADAAKVTVSYGKNDIEDYPVEKFVRTNQNTSFSQTPIVLPGQKVKAGDVLIDGPCTKEGELALGVNLRTAYMVYDGYNFEDGIVISQRVVKEDLLTSVHIQEYIQEVRETKLGNELITRDIPGVGEHALRNLDEDGVVRIGASVSANDILVGIIAPKGESELTAEEKLLRAIFGEYARDVRDNSLRMPYGEHGVVVAVQILDRDSGAKLNAGVLKQVKVWVAKTHRIGIGDKLTGFHGDKGVITKVVAEEDMPHTADGKPVDIILGPSSMIRRMNIGQLMEVHVGELARKAGVKVQVQPFSEFSLDPLLDLAKKKGVAYEEKVDLFDGRTGEQYKQKVTVGMKYMFKLDHLADHKVHARSTGPYTLVTQQPLRGKAQRGGRRFGEMEVWALEAHAVPNVLHEMLTIKSDDVVGRAAAYKAIISGQKITAPNVPESFNVLDKELAGLAIKLDKINAEYDEERADMALEEIVDSIGNGNIMEDPNLTVMDAE